MNIRDDLKAFYVGDRQGTAIYVGSTKVWPINPQIVTVAYDKLTDEQKSLIASKKLEHK